MKKENRDFFSSLNRQVIYSNGKFDPAYVNIHSEHLLQARFFVTVWAIINSEKMIVPRQRGKISILKTISRILLLGMISMSLLQAHTLFYPSGHLFERPGIKKNPEEILRNIYKEVSELGKRKNENFIKREFHFDLDENPTNTEEHIVVLIYDIENGERMVVQVTYFETDGLKHSVKYAKDIKLISCYVDSEKLKIEKCDFNKKEMKPLFSDILKGIKKEKKLFKLIDKKDVEHSGIKKGPRISSLSFPAQ